ncbi:MAG: PfkB family carbohydrate kinase, partial [Thermomicrobiales bacterium]|nr:PfkB family carbohydrate kinase [Thermomicrobiales bacterium]
EGVSTATILRTAAASSGVAQITVDETGQNRIAYVPGAGWEVAPAAALEALDAWNPDIVLSTLELRHETLQTLYEAAKARNVTIICNGTPEPSEGRDLVEHATVLIVNESEALELAGTGAGRGWEDVAGELAKLGPETVILTLGPDGALVWHNGEAARVNTIPVEVVDTTGAGDAFCGAFASFYANGMSPIDATARAVIAGTISATRPGAQPSVPTLHEIEDAFASSRIDQQ